MIGGQAQKESIMSGIIIIDPFPAREGEGIRAQYHEGSGPMRALHFPDAVEDVAIREDSDVDIINEDVVEVPGLLVPEESVRHPDLLRVSESQVLHTT